MKQRIEQILAEINDLKCKTQKAVEEAVLNHVPKGTEEVNLNALHYGAQLVQEAQK